MRDRDTYRRYAEECCRLANTMPEHRAQLLEIAQAWLEVADEGERRPLDLSRSPRDGDGHGGLGV
jgi:hypothetical protein